MALFSAAKYTGGASGCLHECDGMRCTGGGPVFELARGEVLAARARPAPVAGHARAASPRAIAAPSRAARLSHGCEVTEVLR